MDCLKAEIRGDRGMRRKQAFRMANSARRTWFMSPSPSKREIGKLVSTRKQCNCSMCQHPDHSKTISEMKAHDSMNEQLASIGLPSE